MARQLPPLNAIRAFEAAARHLSFSRAADELNVTHAAVSHQIKALEERLGVPLFRRLTRAVRLTDAGQALYPPMRDALDTMAGAVERLRADDAAGTLTVTTTPAFATRWLVPRMGRFYAAHPNIDLRLEPSMTLTDFARDDVDLAIRYGHGDWPGVRSERLLSLDMFPVCSPALVEGTPPLREPYDLRNHTLFHDGLREDWPRWLVAAGVDGVDTSRGPAFSDSGLLIQAAITGLGVAMAQDAMVADDLAAGRLVKPFDLVVPVDAGYYVVCPEETATRPRIAAFRQWIMAEAAKEA